MESWIVYCGGAVFLWIGLCGAIGLVGFVGILSLPMMIDAIGCLFKDMDDLTK